MIQTLSEDQIFIPFAVGVVTVLGLWNLFAMALVWLAWNQVAGGMHALDPKFKAAIGWPQDHALQIKWRWPSEQLSVWRASMRCLLFGLPDHELISDDLQMKTRRYRYRSLLIVVPMMIFLGTLALASTFVLAPIVIFVGLQLIFVGRWPNQQQIFARMASLEQ